VLIYLILKKNKLKIYRQEQSTGQLTLFSLSILIIDKIISDGINSTQYVHLEPHKPTWPRGGMVTQRIANS